MKNNLTAVVRRGPVVLAVCLLMLVVACDDFLPENKEFDPTGTPFNLDPGLAVATITGGPQPVATGTYTIDITARATGGSPVEQSFPAGLLFVSSQRRVQHVIVLKQQRQQFGIENTRRSLGVFCANRYRRTPDDEDPFELGPLTDNRELREIATLIGDKNISGHLWMVQRAVWMVTDSTGLNQVYRDSLNALPTAGAR